MTTSRSSLNRSGNAWYKIEAPVPTLHSQVFLYYCYTPLTTQNFLPFPEHTWKRFILPWHYGQEYISSLLLCPSSLTLNALSSLKPPQTHPVYPFEPYYYTYAMLPIYMNTDCIKQ